MNVEKKRPPVVEEARVREVMVITMKNNLPEMYVYYFVDVLALIYLSLA